jgi:hypothetical protein
MISPVGWMMELDETSRTRTGNWVEGAANRGQQDQEPQVASTVGLVPDPMGSGADSVRLTTASVMK